MSVHNSDHNSDNGDDYIEDPVTLISRLDISNPLHLHPNDSTALTVVSIKLKDEVLGRQWDRVNAVVLGWILNSLPKCVCNASESFKKHNQLMKIMQFLMSLDDFYMQIRSSILSREVLPDVRSTYATISSEESHRVASGSVSGSSLRNQVSAFVSNVSNRGNFQRGQSSNTAPRPNNLNNNRQSGCSGLVCENIGFSGHTIDSSSSGFTDEQMATLISLIKDNKVKKSVQANMAVIVNGKIIDYGANQHMTNNDKELDNVYDISHLKIKVAHPNRTEAFIFKIGNLKLPNGLVLFDVLVIPEYCVTLIFVYKLAKDNKIFVVFDESRCYFLNQDLTLKKVLGIDSASKEVDTTNVFQDLNHINFFDIEYPEMPYDDERVDPKLNSDQKSQSDSSHSLVSSRNMTTVDFLDDKSVNDAQRSDDIFATRDEQVTTLEDNNNSEGNLDQNPDVSTKGTQNLRRPKTYFEASKFSHWIDALNNEMAALLRNDTWEIVDLPKDRKAIGSKWIFKIKYKSSGEIDRYKARLVAQGFGQKERIDYEETFSPVV
ncbi:ribonuclease H-like domain-containing protein [Tanacetum coccineum]